MDFEAYLKEVKDTPFPETEYEYVEMEVEARSIQIGDQLVNHGLAKVADYKVGTKWTEASAQAGKRLFRTLNDMTVTVKRKRVTDASRTADRRVAVLQTLAKQLLNSKSRKELDSTRCRLDHDIAKNYALRYNVIEDLLYADARRVLNAGLYEACDFQVNQPEFTGDLFDAYNVYIEDLTNQVASGYFNRSSNQMSNLMDDIRVEVMREMIRDARWMR